MGVHLHAAVLVGALEEGLDGDAGINNGVDRCVADVGGCEAFNARIEDVATSEEGGEEAYHRLCMTVKEEGACGADNVECRDCWGAGIGEVVSCWLEL